jgi:hypothetical protein
VRLDLGVDFSLLLSVTRIQGLTATRVTKVCTQMSPESTERLETILGLSVRLRGVTKLQKRDRFHRRFAWAKRAGTSEARPGRTQRMEVGGTRPRHLRQCVCLRDAKVPTGLPDGASAAIRSRRGQPSCDRRKAVAPVARALTRSAVPPGFSGTHPSS